MKKLTALTLMLALTLALAACGRATPTTLPIGTVTEAPTEAAAPQATEDDWYASYPPIQLDPELGDMLETIIDGVPDLPMCFNEDIPESLFKSIFFIDPIPGFRAAKSEAVISAPHIVCLLEVPEGTDAAATVAAIEANADPAKWICARADKVIVEHSGNMILLVMSTEAAANAIAENFKEKL
ncbi:MAG: hypothetical protein FWD16_02870 [Clostridia bacterium]|nr:hypothetical protein [Clostridia bacterium]